MMVEKGPVLCGTGPLVSFLLSTETKLLDDASVSLDVGPLKVVEELTSLTYETKEGTTCCNVFLVPLHVLGKMIDTVGK